MTRALLLALAAFTHLVCAEAPASKPFPPIIDIHMHARTSARRTPDGKLAAIPCVPEGCEPKPTIVRSDEDVLGLALEARTAEESGFPGLRAEAWWAVFAPAGTPAPVVARFHEALAAALREERAARQMTQAQQARLVLACPDELGRFLDREIETWGKVVRENGVQAD